MRDLEGSGGERTLRLVAGQLVSADPVLPLMSAPHVAAAFGNGVGIDGLSLEGVAGGGPVAEIAGLEVEIEWFAVSAERQNASRRDELWRILTEDGGENEQGEEKQDPSACRHGGTL